MKPNVTRIELAGVCKRYGDVRALLPLHVELAAGEVVGIVGENGAGKSTLLGMLAGLIRPDAGQVTYWAGTAALTPAAMRATVGLVAHASFLYPALSGAENLRFFLQLYGQDATPAACAALLARVGLREDAWHRPVNTYSRGMAQRTALARALVGAPSVLILDEPFAGLDRAGTQLLQEVVAAHRTQGGLIIVVSHETAPLAAVATRVLALHRGRQVATLQTPFAQADIDALYAARPDGVAP